MQVNAGSYCEHDEVVDERRVICRAYELTGVIYLGADRSREEISTSKASSLKIKRKTKKKNEIKSKHFTERCTQKKKKETPENSIWTAGDDLNYVQLCCSKLTQCSI